jgi:hypothetical protein
MGDIEICPCYCRLTLALLVVVFAWWNVGINQILHTLLGLTLAVLALTPVCCFCLAKPKPVKKTAKKKK